MKDDGTKTTNLRLSVYHGEYVFVLADNFVVAEFRLVSYDVTGVITLGRIFDEVYDSHNLIFNKRGAGDNLKTNNGVSHLFDCFYFR